MSEMLLTERENRVLRRRKEIAALLEQGKTYDEIKIALNVSTSTIALVARLMRGTV